MFGVPSAQGDKVIEKQPPVEAIPEEISGLLEFIEYINRSNVDQDAKKLANELITQLSLKHGYSAVRIREILHQIRAYLEEGTYFFKWVNALLEQFPGPRIQQTASYPESIIEL